MTTTTEAKLLTAADLLRLDGEGVRGELIRGVLCETMPTGQEHGEIVMRLGAALIHFSAPRKLGRVMGSDAGVWLNGTRTRCASPTSRSRRRSRSRSTSGSRLRRGRADLVVEVVSPSDSRRAVHDKVRMWLSHGVRLVWVVYPETRTLDVHRPDRDAATLGEDDALDGLDVLPGFSCAVRAVFGG